MPLDQLAWDDLLTEVNDGSCVPFIGAGANFGCLPLGGALAEELLQVYERSPDAKPCSLRDRRDLMRVTQYLVVVTNNSKRPKTMIRDLIKDKPAPTPSDDEPHEILARLNLPIYITTNYDDNMKKALERHGRDVRVEVCRWNTRMRRQSAFDDPDYRPSPESPLLFYLHGRNDDPESMVATEEDYLDFMVQMSRGLTEWQSGGQTQGMFPPVVLRALTQSLLFIGYSLSDFNLKVILRALSHSFGPRKVFRATVQYDDGNLFAGQEYLEEYFRFALNLSVYWGTSRQFMGELTRRRSPSDA